MDKQSRIYIAGHKGLVGAAIDRHLTDLGYRNIIRKTRTELDLRDESQVSDFFKEQCPDYVFLAAAKVGGILANSQRPAEFIRDNLAIQTAVIHQSYVHGVKKLLCLGSSCIYPKFAEQPISESALLTGPLEPTNSAYALAKIAGIEMCRSYRQQYGCDFISVMPTNLYGPEDNFDLESSHVLPALIRKCHEAKLNGASSLCLWGTGSPKREFLHVDDLAEALVFLMRHYSDEDCINVGVGEDISIKELAVMIGELVGFEGEFDWDNSKPDGTPRKCLDVSKIQALGWRPSIGLRDGIASVYQWYQSELSK